VLPVAAWLPALPPGLPQRPYPAVVRALGHLVLRAGGWSWTGGFPDVSQVVFVGWPHTSNLDGLIGLAAVSVVGLRPAFVAKSELFWPPLSFVLRAFGVVPVDRAAPGGIVGQNVAAFRAGEPRVVGFTPEGTRRRTDGWKMGFYRIAVGAGVPIAVVGFDWGRRRIGVAGTFVPTGDADVDLAAVAALLEGVHGRHPERETPARAARTPRASGPGGTGSRRPT
jgi:1-acyl-sn-glycerol-3-phosphate acyltransferase